MEKNLFEIAVVNKYRFYYKGLITIEELVDLNVRELDSIFKGLQAQLKTMSEESLLDVKSKQDIEITNKIEIIKYLVANKLAEAEAVKLRKEKSEKKQKLMELIEQKENTALSEKSVDDLKSMLAELD